jgi:hypothetical protein
MKNKTDSKYGVFIIESIDIKNEIKGKLDGYTLKKTLDLCDIPNKYFYIRTSLELEKIIKIFERSEFKYLHIACHGNEKELCFTYENVSFDQLDIFIGPYLRHRRLFLSACQVARFELARYFVPKYHCFSVIGSPDNIDYDKAAVFWSSFYFLMYTCDKTNMYQRDMIPVLENTTKLFNLRLNYFSIINSRNQKSYDNLREINYNSGKKVLDCFRETGFRNIFRE